MIPATIRHLGPWLVILLAWAGVRADDPTSPTASATPAIAAAGHSIHGEAFNDGPRRRASLMEGMGQVDFPVTTAQPEAQAFINQGVAQLHSFLYFEAERSFREAARIDPECAMTYWGMAMANVYNPQRARKFLAEAQRRAERISPRERLHLDALAAWFQEGADENSRLLNRLKVLKELVHHFPDDQDARAWLAMLIWENIGEPGVETRQTAESLLETVLSTQPTHPGAHHYRIHLWDGVNQKIALKSAPLYAGSAPGIAHAWHMPGHTYTGLRRYSDAAYQQEGSARVDHAYMIRDRIMPFEIYNYAHNNQWLATSLSHVGRARDAVAVARNLVEQPRDPQKNSSTDEDSAQRSGRLRWVEVLIRYELWDDLIAATTSGALDWSEVPAERKERAYSLGLAYAAQGDQARLDEQAAVLWGMIDQETRKPRRGGSSRRGRRERDSALVRDLRAAHAELEGHLELLQGQVPAALVWFRKATAMRSESLARVYLAAGDLGKAETTAQAAVVKAPKEVSQLAAYVEVLAAIGKRTKAQQLYRTLAPLAHEADPDLPVFRRLAPIVASWTSEGSWTPPDPRPPDRPGSPVRIDLTTLGPLTWSPFLAEPFAKPDTEGHPWDLAEHRGQNVVVLFFLGGQCAHCLQQLQIFGEEMDAFRKLDTKIVALSTDDAETTRLLKDNTEGIEFPMPLMADPDLEVFRRYQAFDDFEGQPLHGTVLIDTLGQVRWQRISADPFLDVDFLKAEVARVNRLMSRSDPDRP